jgi:hypothetical protein
MQLPQSAQVRPAPYIDREQSIVRYLKELEDPDQGASIRDIWEAVSERLREQKVSVSAYHKVIEKMVAQHKLEEVPASDPQEPRRYKVAPHLFPENAITLDDFYENLWKMSPGDAVAKYVDALDYFDEKQPTTLKRAAELLRSENPVDLVFRMLSERVALFNKHLEVWREQDLREPSLKHAIEREHQRLIVFVCQGIGIPPGVLDLKSSDEFLDGNSLEIVFDSTVQAGLKETLSKRIVGPNFILEVDAEEVFDPGDQRRAVVVGSDGSTHAGVLGGVTAPRFFDDPPGQVLSFNNSIAFFEFAGDQDGVPEYPLTGVPMTRAALEDPSNRGMVMAPFMFSDLDDSEYEHMKKCATDVVQLRVDEKVVTGTARSLGTHMEKLPRPTVVIRDGTVVPQERDFHHYARRDDYGEMVQEGIALSSSILSAVNTSPVVYAGAVKFTQIRLFVEILNWFIVSGSRDRLGEALDPNWDISRAGHITDNAAMSRLLSTLKPSSKSHYLCSCVLIRPFFALVYELNRQKVSDGGWLNYFKDRRDEQVKRWKAHGGARPYLDTIELDGDPYPRMCEDADYAMFYIGHTAGDPAPMAPRYEFLDTLRRLAVPNLHDRVMEKVNRIIACLHLTGFSLDREHNYFTTKMLVKIIPYVVFNAHEHCKVLGGKLESELKSEVVARLNQLKTGRGLSPSQVSLIPLGIRKYIERSKKILDKKSLADEDSEQ